MTATAVADSDAPKTHFDPASGLCSCTCKWTGHAQYSGDADRLIAEHILMCDLWVVWRERAAS